ncbi:hypothetical protein AGMMS50276_25280 [Synergistales bacterium]|nr:hypothetical protein AGMMS50276_25280 [Synergistales bacterium]
MKKSLWMLAGVALFSIILGVSSNAALAFSEGARCGNENGALFPRGIRGRQPFVIQDGRNERDRDLTGFIYKTCKQ